MASKSQFLVKDTKMNNEKDIEAVRSSPGRRNPGRRARPDNIIWVPYKKCISDDGSAIETWAYSTRSGTEDKSPATKKKKEMSESDGRDGKVKTEDGAKKLKMEGGTKRKFEDAWKDAQSEADTESGGKAKEQANKKAKKASDDEVINLCSD